MAQLIRQIDFYLWLDQSKTGKQKCFRQLPKSTLHFAQNLDRGTGVIASPMSSERKSKVAASEYEYDQHQPRRKNQNNWS